MDKEGIFAGISGGAVLKTAQRAAAALREGATSSCCWPTAAGSTSRSNLWTADYSNLPDDLEAKTWW